MQQRKVLGKGLDSLLPPIITNTTSTSVSTPVKEISHSPLLIPIEKIVPNRLQPRTHFNEEKIRELADSIREDGVIQPLIVSPPENGRYELIAGERRLKASKLAGLTEVPVIIKSVDQTSVLILSLIENIQRQDLNAIEEAAAFNELIGNFGLTQEEVSKRVGKSRVAVANSLRLLKLPKTIQEDIVEGRYSAGHARALLSVESIHEQLKIREWIIKTSPSVRAVEQKISTERESTKTIQKPNNQLSPQLTTVLDKMCSTLGTKINIKTNASGGGKLIIDYYTWQDLDKIYRLITSACSM
ncbi:MAG: chromosome partitioning protein ParB [Deltaproteobacteria bacterium CG07_land_8_20_14_0_80_38_7]|nr:MAG: chromosome partitioning protein ParB [Deltaproteobacteria bacterium CG07_land_8_20_14_0_80_38_7]